jgi:hypothetical protein
MESDRELIDVLADEVVLFVDVITTGIERNFDTRFSEDVFERIVRINELEV